MRRAPALRGTGLELGARTVRAVAPGALQAAFLGRAQGREPRATAAAAPRTRSDPLRGGVARPGGKARQRWHALVRPRAPARLLRARSALSGSLGAASEEVQSLPLPAPVRASTGPPDCRKSEAAVASETIDSLLPCFCPPPTRFGPCHPDYLESVTRPVRGPWKGSMV